MQTSKNGLARYTSFSGEHLVCPEPGRSIGCDLRTSSDRNPPGDPNNIIVAHVRDARNKKKTYIQVYALRFYETRKRNEKRRAREHFFVGDPAGIVPRHGSIA